MTEPEITSYIGNPHARPKLTVVRGKIRLSGHANWGVKRVGRMDHIQLQCIYCEQQWGPDLLPLGGRLPKDWWKCPDGCTDANEPRLAITLASDPRHNQYPDPLANR